MSEQTGATVPGEGHQHATTATAAAISSTFMNRTPYSHAQPSVHPDRTQAFVLTSQSDGVAGFGSGPAIRTRAKEVQLFCGPLLNYRRMSREDGQSRWHGSVLIVISPGAPQPRLLVRCSGGIGTTNRPRGPSDPIYAAGEKLYEDPKKAFWRFLIRVPIQEFEAKWEYSIPTFSFGSTSQTFVVPAQTQSMRIMFHSCNGFSVGTDTEAWSGPALWNDVNGMHAAVPFHVMIGGGDQIYNDGVRVDGPLKTWTEIGNPKKRRDFPFNEELRAECDEYYYQNYISWYSTEPFKTANGTIPQLNIWDDHDIIDGFGSYVSFGFWPEAFGDFDLRSTLSDPLDSLKLLICPPYLC